MEWLEEIHPGEILQEEFMRPLGLSVRRLARDLDVPPSRISELIHGRRPITPDTALRLGGTSRSLASLRTESPRGRRNSSCRISPG